MQKELKIKVDKNKYLYGKFDGSLKKPLLIFVHGLTGNSDEFLPVTFARYFLKKDFSVFCVNFYSWQKDARQLVDCTLETNAADIDAVVAYFRKKGVKKIFIAGHSYFELRNTKGVSF